MTKKIMDDLSENEQVYFKFLKKQKQPVKIREIQQKIVRDDGEELTQSTHYNFLISLEKKGMIVRSGQRFGYAWSCSEQNV